MSQTILERSQYRYNQMKWNAIGQGITAAKEADDEYKIQMQNEIQNRSRVTIQPEVDPVILKREIQEDIKSELRPEAGQAPKVEHHIAEQKYFNIGVDYSISDLQQYVNNKGRVIERKDYNNEKTHQPEMQEQLDVMSNERQEHHVVAPFEEQNDFVARSANNVKETRVNVDENELG